MAEVAADYYLAWWDVVDYFLDHVVAIEEDYVDIEVHKKGVNASAGRK